MSTSASSQPLLDEAERLGCPLDVEATGRFARYLELIEEWNSRAGLTAITDPAEVQRRLFGESIALLQALRSAGLVAAEATTVADIGTGGGFPGLPMRILAPNLQLTLIEAQARRCQFLETVVAELGLENVRVVVARAEDAGRAPDLRGAFDLVVARALAALPVLVEYALPLLRNGRVLATPKGSRALEEQREAAAAVALLGGTIEDGVPLDVPAGAPEQHVVLVRRTGPLHDRYPRRAGVPTRRPLR